MGGTLAERLRDTHSGTWWNVSMNGWESVARQALAVVTKQLPTREEIAATIEKAHWPQSVGSHERTLWIADALLRDLRERLGVEG